MSRTAVVGFVKTLSISAGSILQVGDTAEVTPEAQVFALKRELPRFDGNEGDLSGYPLYTQAFPAVEVYETLGWSVQNADPYLRAGIIEIMGVSASSIVHIGNTSIIATKARIKQIRHISPETAAADQAQDSAEE